MSATNGAQVLDEDTKKALEAFRAAARDGQPPPGRPTLADQFGWTDYRARLARDKAVAALAKEARERELATEDSRPQSPATQPPSTETAEPHQPSEAVGGSPDETSPVTLPAEPAGDTSLEPGARVWAWLGFWFGAVMSVAANVLHAWLPADEMPPGWWPGLAPQVGSAVWPVGLLISVEVLSRARWRRGFLWGLARYVGTGTVAVGSAIISYGHLREVLLAWGYGDLGASVGPLVLDGLMVVSGFALLSMSDRQGGATP